MKTCSTCKYWQCNGARTMQGRIILDHRVLTVPIGPEGHCRRMPPVGDNRWPLTSAGDWCGEHSALREDVRIEMKMPSMEMQLAKILTDAEDGAPGTANTGQPAVEITPGGGTSAAPRGAAMEGAAAPKAAPATGKPHRPAESAQRAVR